MDGIEYSFQKLKAWQEAKKLVVDVYHLLDCFPKFEKYAICDQIRRAVVSVPSNIAEGSGRKSLKEQILLKNVFRRSLQSADRSSESFRIRKSRSSGPLPALGRISSVRRDWQSKEGVRS